MNAETKQSVALHTAKSIYEAYPQLWDKFGEKGFIHTEKDNHHHLEHLETAFSLDDPNVFMEYAKWLETVLNSRNVETELIVDNFNRLIKVLPGKVTEEEETFMVECLGNAIVLLKSP